MEAQKFKLYLNPDRRPPVVFADQYDVGRVFQATVYDMDGCLHTFDGTENVTVVGTKPSGTGFAYEATASGNIVTFETTGQMTVVAGNVTCGVIIEKSGDRIGTLHFVLHVQPAALDAETIVDSNDFDNIIHNAIAVFIAEHGTGVPMGGTEGQVLTKKGNDNLDTEWADPPGGDGGENGATFTPSVSPAGVISWTNDKGLENPDPVNIKGPAGPTGPQGPAYTLTAADKAEIVDDVLDALPTWTGGSY